MADILTQLQDCLDQLSTQFTASLSHPLHHSPPSPPSPPTHNLPSNPPLPLHELASDLLHKTSQIDILIAHLPTNPSRAHQEARMRALEDELVAVEEERRVAVRGRERAVRGLEDVIAGVRR